MNIPDKPQTQLSDQPAFPCPVGHIECNHPPGMTLLQYYAGLAMMGELASSGSPESAEAIAIAAVKSHRSPAAKIAFNAMETAQALIAELSKR